MFTNIKEHQNKLTFSSFPKHATREGVTLSPASLVKISVLPSLEIISVT